jgi:hypothetical protein
VEIVEAEPAEERDVASHVSDYINTSDFAERAALLGERVGLADDAMEAHLHEKFDHQLGQLARDESPPETQADRSGEPRAGGADISATGISQMLGSIQNLRQAIALAEILKRPEW